jgi:hypothetical protein
MTSKKNKKYGLKKKDVTINPNTYPRIQNGLISFNLAVAASLIPQVISIYNIGKRVMNKNSIARIK